MSGGRINSSTRTRLLARDSVDGMYPKPPNFSNFEKYVLRGILPGILWVIDDSLEQNVIYVSEDVKAIYYSEQDSL